MICGEDCNFDDETLSLFEMTFVVGEGYRLSPVLLANARGFLADVTGVLLLLLLDLLLPQLLEQSQQQDSEIEQSLQAMNLTRLFNVVVQWR